ncbi:hypothetical protein CEXT_30881 [Caerostris extrusa]|uniref:Uncharacterized protein n=1 Tax=Caerostris extrusa TaxID=172846 RepID=A0AAV4XT39_CAEEX|nr:hypothetical protein CEXT_30881 [Caerostris extrusa]
MLLDTFDLPAWPSSNGSGTISMYGKSRNLQILCKVTDTIVIDVTTVPDRLLISCLNPWQKQVRKPYTVALSSRCPTIIYSDRQAKQLWDLWKLVMDKQKDIASSPGFGNKVILCHHNEARQIHQA